MSFSELRTALEGDSDDCVYSVRALQRHLEQLPPSTSSSNSAGLRRFARPCSVLQSGMGSNSDAIGDNDGASATLRHSDTSSQERRTKDRPLADMLQQLNDAYNRTAVQVAEDGSSAGNRNHFIVSVMPQLCETGTQTEDALTGHSGPQQDLAPSTQHIAHSCHVEGLGLSLKALYPHSARFTAVRLVQFHGARLGLSLVRGASKRRLPASAVPALGAIASNICVSDFSSCVVHESVVVQSKNALLLTQEAFACIQVGDEIVSIAEVCPLAGVYTFAQQMEMIKSSSRPLVLGFVTIS